MQKYVALNTSLPPETRHQIDELAARWGTIGSVIAIAVERLHRETFGTEREERDHPARE